MCGICGFNYKDKKVVKMMSDEIAHRGPNGDGFYIDENVSLGHRRLSIIDLKGGKNPIYNEDKTICVMFNGEIYNFQELRLQLEKKGHIFSTNADTDTIVHSYEEYGYDCLKYFNGMFAFSLYDKKRKILFLARDRFGVKPLYYYHKDGKFIFASEIKAILKNPNVKTKPNDKIILNYLKNNEIPEHIPETFFENIYKLLPSHYAIVQGGKLKIKQYYQVKTINNSISSFEDQSAQIKKYKELFTDSVRLRLISDVPVGSCLSGGVDSSSIVAVIDELLKKHVKEGASVHGRLNCFSAVYDDPACDEREYIKAALKNKQTISHYTFPESDGFWRDLKKVIYHQDEPTETIAVYAQYCVMKLAKGKVKVLLDGQGSDECVAGYIPYYRHYLLDLLKNFKLIQFAKEIVLGFNFHKGLVASFFKITQSQNLTANFFPNNNIALTNYVANSNMTLSQRQYHDLTHNLPKVLKYEDRNSMAFGIEARLPFLDYRLVEYSFSLPEGMKIRNGWTKYVLRQAMKGTVSDTIVNRKSKYGYPVPDYQWLLDNKDAILKIFTSKKFGGRRYFNQKEIVEMFQRYTQNSSLSNLSTHFWRILNLELWLRIFFTKT